MKLGKKVNLIGQSFLLRPIILFSMDNMAAKTTFLCMTDENLCPAHPRKTPFTFFTKIKKKFIKMFFF